MKKVSFNLNKNKTIYFFKDEIIMKNKINKGFNIILTLPIIIMLLLLIIIY